MKLALCGMSALRVLRDLRQRHVDVTRLPRVDLPAPSLEGSLRWSRAAILRAIEQYPCLADFSERHPLCVAVPTAATRLRVKGVSCTVHGKGLPANAFVDVGGGLFISSPELLFIELAGIMLPEVHLVVGMELCGTFARDASDPRNGSVAYQIPAVTSVDRIQAFVDGCHHVNGLGPARETLEWLLDNAWSPMEAVVAAMAVLPGAMLGYDLWPIDLNVPIDARGGTATGTRIPDLVFRGTDVGLNYDGEGHLPLQDVVDAAIRLASLPQEKATQEGLDDALRRAREGAVADKRRDRDLGAAGLTVFAMTKEDLYERGGLDRLMLQVMDAISRTGKRDLSRQRTMMESKLLGDLRQELIWSFLPGKVGQEAAQTFAELSAPNPDITRYMKMARFVDGKWVVSLVERSSSAALPGD